MPTNRRMSYDRLKEILRRQDPPAFGKDYEPSIKALSAEAPAVSNNGVIWFETIEREVHYLSGPERSVLPIILYCPWLFDIQEQRMLPFLPAEHPLHGHPRAARLILPQFRGTLAVAEELGAFHVHPFVSTADTKSPSPDIGVDDVPGCWIGDYLLFLCDSEGPYNVNISVKQKASDFEVPKIKCTPRSEKRRVGYRQEIRRKAEEILYQDLGIPTINVAANQLHAMVVANLRHLVALQRRRTTLNEEQESMVLEAFRVAVESGDSPLAISHHLAVHEHICLEDAKDVFYKAIFRRKLRIDLREPILFNYPLYPETVDVLEMYGHWFRRTTH